jgi:hypothetical protein
MPANDLIEDFKGLYLKATGLLNASGTELYGSAGLNGILGATTPAAATVTTLTATTIAGTPSYTGLPRHLATNAITAFATGGQTNATALTSTINRVTTCATAHDSVKLPTSVAGMIISVVNDGATALDVYPVTGDLIGTLAANVPVTIPVGRESIFSCAVAGTWSEKRPALVVAQFATGTTTTTFAAGQLTGAEFVTYTNTQGTPGSIATRTATQMFQDDPQARVGGTYVLRIVNGQGTGTLTVTAGTGVTLTGTMTVAVNTTRDFIVTYTSATALTIQNIGTGTFS